MKIKKIYKEKFSGDVYNFGVENDPTYFANNVLVHNCRSILVSIIFDDEFKSAQDEQGGANAINKKAQDALVFIPNTFGGLKNNNTVIK